MTTSSSGSTNGNGSSSTALTRLKIALFAPMPSAMISTASTAKPGVRAKVRAA